MTYETNMAPDGILRISLSDNIDNGDMTSFIKDITLYLNAATPIEPLLSIAQVEQVAGISREARTKFNELNADMRFGKFAIVGNNRHFRVMAKFMNKATQRENVRSFSNEDDALEWIKQPHSSNGQPTHAFDLAQDIVT